MAPFSILAVGDVILDEPDPASFFDPSRKMLAGGSVVIGHVEVPHSTTTQRTSTDVPAPPADPAALSSMAEAGFNAVTLAGNHIADCGPEGLLDTVRHAQAAGMATVGAGANLTAAREPAVVSRDGRTVALLSYNCVGPKESWATSTKPGCAYLHVLTHYELDHASPGGPPRIYTFPDPVQLEWLAEDVAKARQQADYVIVAYHKGIGHTPAALAMYEVPVSHAAIDAGADAVVAHHAHIMRGIEMYRGRPIFHGLGNFVTVTRALTPTMTDNAERQEWARRRQQLYGFAPDPNMPAYPFHPESRNTAVAVLREVDGTLAAGLIPCWIDDDARPVPLRRDNGADRVVSYIEAISRQAGFATRFTWGPDDVVALDGGSGTGQ